MKNLAENYLYELNSSVYFKPLDFDIKKATKDVSYNDYNSEYDEIVRKFAIDAKERANDIDVLRRKKVRPCARANRLAFPTDGGYMTYKEYRTGVFFGKLFELAKSHGLFEPKLLINHALQQPLYSRIYYNPDYKINIKIPESYCKLWHKFLAILVARSQIDDVKFYAHKITSPGPPFMLYDKIPYDKNDMLYGLLEDMDNAVISALRKDYTLIKTSYLPHIDEIHEEQLRYADIGLVNIRANLIDLYQRCIIPTSVPGYRLNSIDKVDIDVNAKFNIRDRYYSKDRNFTIFSDKVISGKINNKYLTDHFNEVGSYPYYFGTNRSREITNISWPSQLSAVINTKMTTAYIEKGPNAFAADRPIIKESYSRYLTYCNSRSGEFLFLNGDRSNAETFVTTNYDWFEDLIPPFLRKLYRFQNTTISFSERIYVMGGLPSGMARTTELNWFMGTYEAIYTISKLLMCDISEVATAYFNCVLDNNDYFEVNGYVMKLFMVTDDIPLVIHGDIYRLKLDYLTSEEARSRKMEWLSSTDGMVTFGMQFNENELKPAQVSVIAKLFYTEKPGFYAKDCFSLMSKLNLLPAELRKDIINLYETHTGTSLSYIDRGATAFKSWLKDFGVSIDSVVDIYSPSGKIIFGDLVSKDPILDSSRVSSEHFINVFKYYKRLYS